MGAGFPDKTWKDCSLGSFGLWWLHAVLILLPPHFHCRANFIEHTRMMITISICDDSNRNYHNNENDKDTDNSDDTACRIVVKLILFLNWKKYKMYKISIKMYKISKKPYLNLRMCPFVGKHSTAVPETNMFKSFALVWLDSCHYMHGKVKRETFFFLTHYLDRFLPWNLWLDCTNLKTKRWKDRSASGVIQWGVSPLQPRPLIGPLNHSRSRCQENLAYHPSLCSLCWHEISNSWNWTIRSLCK